MVVRTRIRAILFPILLYAVSGSMSAYFIHTALNGERGVKTKEDYRQQIFALRHDLDQLKSEHDHWQHRVTLMRSDALDRDLAEEQARLKLDYVDSRDLVIFEDSAVKR